MMDGPRPDAGLRRAESREHAFGPGRTEQGSIPGSSVEKLETVLVVDDTDIVRELLVKILREANFLVLEADSGAAALKLAADYEGRIDLLLSDITMPGMSGHDLVKSLTASRPEVRVLLTGGDFLDQGADHAFIQKPFSALQLIEMIQSVLRTS
jgi:two-component system cell cycle sensor histidine kinase/response regulator CckA